MSSFSMFPLHSIFEDERRREEDRTRIGEAYAEFRVILHYSEKAEISHSILRSLSARKVFRLKYSGEIERVDSDCHAKSILS